MSLRRYSSISYPTHNSPETAPGSSRLPMPDYYIDNTNLNQYSLKHRLEPIEPKVDNSIRINYFSSSPLSVKSRDSFTLPSINDLLNSATPDFGSLNSKRYSNNTRYEYVAIEKDADSINNDIFFNNKARENHIYHPYTNRRHTVINLPPLSQHLGALKDRQPTVAKPKRHRRKFEEIERTFKCTYGNCQKSYGTLNHLNSHITLQGHGKRKTANDFKHLLISE